MSFQLVYPDVLGTITGGARAVTDHIQYGVGIFPKQAFVQQPVEVVVVLQNMMNVEIITRVQVKVPSRMKSGDEIRISVSNSSLEKQLAPAEVGIMRIPLAVMPPTPALSNIPVRVSVESRPGRKATGMLMRAVRPPDGGPPPSVLAVSPFRMNVLKDIDFSDMLSEQSLTTPTVRFSIADQTLPTPPTNFKPAYETIWASEQVEQEQELAHAQIEAARRTALDARHGTSYYHFIEETQERFSLAGLPLHPGEARAIAKLMAYTVDVAPVTERNIQFENLRWFRTLCQLYAHDPALVDMHRGELLAHYIYDAIILDAIGFGFKVVQPRTSEDLGDVQERIAYANRVLTWLSGQGSPDLNYVYLPLALGGVVINKLVRLDAREPEWRMFDELREAMQGRLSLLDSASIVVFDILADLLDAAENEIRLRRQRGE